MSELKLYHFPYHPLGRNKKVSVGHLCFVVINNLLSVLPSKSYIYELYTIPFLVIMFHILEGFVPVGDNNDRMVRRDLHQSKNLVVPTGTISMKVEKIEFYKCLYVYDNPYITSYILVEKVQVTKQ